MSYLGDEYEKLLCRYNKEGVEKEKEILLLKGKLRDACRLIWDIQQGMEEPEYCELNQKGKAMLTLSAKNMLKLERYATLPKCAYEVEENHD